jgi:hypothetical protein
MTPTFDMDSILERAEWEQWRSKQEADPVILAAAARAWCTSSFWKSHTPRLENWKIVVSDLGSEALTESAVEAMAAANGNHLPFPPIPMFEYEQVQDLCGIMPDADAAVALAEKLEANDQLLTLEPSEAAMRCFEYVSATAKRGIDYPAWLWMMNPSASRPQPWPTREGLEGLRALASPRRGAALRRLEEEFRNRKAREQQAAEAAANEAAAKQSAEAQSAETQATAQTEDTRTSRTRNEQLAAGLFEGTPDYGSWAQVAAEVRRRPPRAGTPHPLAEMTQYLREHDFPSSRDGAAWNALSKIFGSYPELLEIDRAEPEAPLPALELACMVRSTVTPGTVALGLLVLAGVCKRSAAWWRAVRPALEPKQRRGGWRNANDKGETAIRVLLLRSRELDQAEAAAMRTGFSRAL